MWAFALWYILTINLLKTIELHWVKNKKNWINITCVSDDCSHPLIIGLSFWFTVAENISIVSLSQFVYYFSQEDPVCRQQETADGWGKNKQTNQGTLKGLNNKGAVQWEKKAHWTNTIQKSNRNDPKKIRRQQKKTNNMRESNRWTPTLMRVGKRTTAWSKNGKKELTFKIKKASNLKGRLRINSHRPKDRWRLGKKTWESTKTE